MKKTLVTVLALMAAPAIAQTDSDTIPPSSMGDSGSMTEAQIKQVLEQRGYSNILLNPHRQEWIGTAMTRDGRQVNITVNGLTGQVREEK